MLPLNKSKAAQYIDSAQERHLLRWAILASTLFAISLAAIFLGLVLLRAPLPAFLAFSMGILIRAIGQQVNVKRLKHSSHVAELATFTFDGQSIDSSFNNRKIVCYINSWTWKIASALSAGLVCLTTLHLSIDSLSLLPAQISAVHWLNSIVESGCDILPVLTVIFFLWANAPERRWTGQVKAAIEARTAAALDFRVNREIEGLEAGIEILGEELGIWQERPHRAAMEKRLSSHTIETVLKPEITLAIHQAITELARQDMISLGAVTTGYRKVASDLKSVELLVSLLRDPIQEARTDELSVELAAIPILAANRQWEECQQKTNALECELKEIHTRLRRQLASASPTVLPPGADPYKILGVNAATPTAVIKKLRLRLAQLYHPDISESTSNSIKMAEVNAAYDAVMRSRETAGL